MIILRQSIYSKKLGAVDKANLWLTKNVTPKSMRKMMKDMVDDDEETRKEAIKKNRRFGAAAGAISGAILGHTLYGNGGVLPGAAVGGLVFYGADKLGEEGKLGKSTKELREMNKKKNRDAVLVAEGKMTKEEFIKKWGK